MGVAGVAVLAWLVALSVFDLRERRLPNWLTMPGALVILIVAVAAGRGLTAVAGAVVLFAVYLLVHLLAPAAMGAGDVKLSVGVGALTGAFGVDIWTLAALGAPLITACWALLAAIRRTEATVPHGASMCLTVAAAVALAVA
ncbi:A24 family peptidase [Mycobacterium sp. E740]|uniref:prepilin peptidase n=1 Tax=Mycobacterium sp. E740 TaxID=1834149 RepID=UPI0007FED152|nr:A24 family peptidase [Mycobacterium sp. E740]OBI81258.1 peptidase A24 [Mycobacterium sp. E740]